MFRICWLPLCNASYSAQSCWEEILATWISRSQRLLSSHARRASNWVRLTQRSTLSGLWIPSRWKIIHLWMINPLSSLFPDIFLCMWNIDVFLSLIRDLSTLSFFSKKHLLVCKLSQYCRSRLSILSIFACHDLYNFPPSWIQKVLPCTLRLHVLNFLHNEFCLPGWKPERNSSSQPPALGSPWDLLCQPDPSETEQVGKLAPGLRWRHSSLARSLRGMSLSRRPWCPWSVPGALSAAATVRAPFLSYLCCGLVSWWCSFWNRLCSPPKPEPLRILH